VIFLVICAENWNSGIEQLKASGTAGVTVSGIATAGAVAGGFKDLPYY